MLIKKVNLIDNIKYYKTKEIQRIELGQKSIQIQQNNNDNIAAAATALKVIQDKQNQNSINVLLSNKKSNDTQDSQKQSNHNQRLTKSSSRMQYLNAETQIKSYQKQQLSPVSQHHLSLVQ